MEIEGEEPEYEVEEILDSQKTKVGKMYYKVKWKGYGLEDASWEPVEGLEGAPKAIAQYHKRYPKKPSPKSLRTVILEGG